MAKTDKEILKEKADIEALSSDSENIQLVLSRVETLEEAFHDLITAYEKSTDHIGFKTFMANSAVSCQKFASNAIKKARSVL